MCKMGHTELQMLRGVAMTLSLEISRGHSNPRKLAVCKCFGGLGLSMALKPAGSQEPELCRGLKKRSRFLTRNG